MVPKHSAEAREDGNKEIKDKKIKFQASRGSSKTLEESSC